MLGELGFPIEVGGWGHGQVAVSAFGSSVPLVLVHEYAAFVVKGDTFFGQHLALLVGAAEGKAGGHAPVLEHDAMAGNASRIGAGLRVHVEGVPHIARGPRRADEPAHLAVGCHLAARNAPHHTKHSVSKIAHDAPSRLPIVYAEGTIAERTSEKQRRGAVALTSAPRVWGTGSDLRRPIMKIAFVMDDMSEHSNGTSATAERYAASLREQGHDVVCVAFGAEGPDGFNVPERNIPIVTQVAEGLDFHFAEPEDAVFDEAFEGVDVIHIFLPFALGQRARDWGRAHHVPVTAAFHLQPENVTYNAHIGAAPMVCDVIYDLFRHWLYDDIRHIHCPSEMIVRQLREHGYTAELHVISNGVPAAFSPGEGEVFEDGLVHIVTVGRLSAEKDQATIIRAIARCRHADNIQLHICGEGPLHREIEREGASLPHPPLIEFRSQEDLIALERACPLYVHASTADIEAISVIEALACGCIPIIARAEMSAPAQFALTEESLFEAGDDEHLAALIDWWIDHPNAQEKWRPRYIEEGAADHVDACTRRFVAMLQEAIADDAAAYAAE